MMLRASVDTELPTSTPADAIETRSGLLELFVDAVVGDDPLAADDARDLLVDQLGPDWLVDVSAVIANFEMMTRLADATGARLRPEQIDAAATIIEELGLGAFASSRL